jgi:hypothetical protein
VRAIRRRRSVAAETEEVEAMRLAIALRARARRDGLPRPEFVAELRHRLAEALDG